METTEKATKDFWELKKWYQKAIYVMGILSVIGFGLQLLAFLIGG